MCAGIVARSVNVADVSVNIASIRGLIVWNVRGSYARVRILNSGIFKGCSYGVLACLVNDDGSGQHAGAKAECVTVDPGKWLPVLLQVLRTLSRAFTLQGHEGGICATI